jgi:hypothetical protein
LLGRGWSQAATVVELADAVSPAGARALRGVRDPQDLWRAEVRWWGRLHADGVRLLASATFGPDPAIGAAALHAVDAWQVRAALEVAARGGGVPTDALGVFDAVA